MNRVFQAGIGMVIGLTLTIGIYSLIDSSYTYQGVLIDPPAKSSDIELTDQQGQLFRLSQQAAKISLIFFGYTNCPDVCPITLSLYKEIKKQLGDQSSEVQFILITVDPERDSPDQLRRYVSNFDPDFIGLTGKQSELEMVWKAYGVYQEHVEIESKTGYLVDHSARIYVVDKFGYWRLNYPFGMDANQIVQDLLHLLKELKS